MEEEEEEEKSGRDNGQNNDNSHETGGRMGGASPRAAATSIEWSTSDGLQLAPGEISKGRCEGSPLYVPMPPPGVCVQMSSLALSYRLIT